MLTEHQIESLAQQFFDRMQAVNTQYLELIGARLKELGTISPNDATRLARMMEWSLTDAAKITKALTEATNKNVADVEHILRRVAEDNYDFAEPFYKAKAVDYVAYSQNTALVGLVRGIVEETQGTLENFSRTTSVQDIYRTWLDDAALKANLGLENYTTAIRSTVREVADRGIYRVEYASGRRMRLDSAARMNILGAMKTVNLRSSELIGQQFGSDGVEISAHGGCRPSHRSMQGRRYNLKDFESSGAKAKLSEVNCRHMCFPIIMGVGEKAITAEQLKEIKDRDARKFDWNGKQIDGYEASQVMRRIETKVRQQKDLQNLAKASGDETLRLDAKRKITALNAEYVRISKASGLPMQRERMAVVNTAKKTSVTPVKVSKPSPSLFDGVETSYKNILQSKFDSGSADVKAIYEKHIPKGGAVSNSTHRSAFYSPQSKTISMNFANDMKNERGSGTTWFHEHGHFLDAAMGSPSLKNDYNKAIRKDISELEKLFKKTSGNSLYIARENISKELKELGDVTHSLQDLFYGSTKGKQYNMKWCHAPSYWKLAPERLGMEAFAHMFEASFNKEKTELFKKYLPSSWEMFQDIIKGDLND